ncbi:MAG: response regulator transcription factor [Bacteroidales bacterium]
MNRFKYALAESSFVIREGIKSLLNSYPNVELVEEGNTCEVLSSHKLDNSIDLLIINIPQLKEKDIKKIKWISGNHKTKIIGLTDNVCPQKWDNIFYEIIHINEADKSLYIDLFDKTFKNNPKENQNTLSQREKAILKHIAMGQTNNEIAENLFISSHTVMTHRKNITRKLAIKTVSGLTVYALLNGIVRIEELQ